MAEFEVCRDCKRLVAGDRLTIDRTEYEALKRKADAFDQSSARLNTFRHRSKSPIARNRDLSVFILENASAMTLKELVAACRVEFPNHAPSRSAIDRFLKAVR